MKLLRQDQRQVSRALQSQDARWRIISQCTADTSITDTKTDGLRVHALSTFCQNMWLRAWIKVKTHVGWEKLTKTFFRICVISRSLCQIAMPTLPAGDCSTPFRKCAPSSVKASRGLPPTPRPHLAMPSLGGGGETGGDFHPGSAAAVLMTGLFIIRYELPSLLPPGNITFNFEKSHK